ncbi:AAA family ATPase [Polyangium jinanense]|uniref:AAA family ATPase n=1 Tax=Polyangium jinanense TaxID=2829994 RepID=A0A9X4ATY7_9BACT|nr:AAA family ATPase [Polyangium jinanense]MDC3957270.1 AAA family ATPase [Polyangium jinanense]MDC3982672.1 AAA family ATPase [Polyangium jinanense]
MFLRSLKLNRLLSFGPDAEAVELRPLNVLIGPNGSGKSNFIEAIGLLKATPKDLAVPIREGGGIGAWIWQGAPGKTAEIVAEIDYGAPTRHNRFQPPMRHRLTLFDADHRAMIGIEKLEEIVVTGEARRPEVYFDAEWMGGANLFIDGQTRELQPWDRGQSVVSQVKGPDYPALDVLGAFYESIRLYRDFNFGRRSPPRRPQPADLPTDHLMESTENLGLILNKFRRDVPTKKALIEALKNIFEGVTDFSVQVEGGTVQIFLEEERWTIPASRLSDGTMRWLSLLAILLDPKPPPLVCIEEPELGLHPDLMTPLARLLKDASERMQLIITTHSEALVDAFRHTPEDVLVCERREGSTTMRRLDREQLAEWLQDYSLGQLWSKGILGGNRW